MAVDDTNDSDHEMEEHQVVSVVNIGANGADADFNGGGVDEEKQGGDAMIMNAQKRGRGHEPTVQSDISYPSKSGQFDTLASFDTDSADRNVQKSVEGYVLFVTGIHEEAKDDDIYDKFSEFGHVKQFNVPLDRRTGFVKGYALVEFATFKEAQAALQGADQTELYGKILTVDWTFCRKQ